MSSVRGNQCSRGGPPYPVQFLEFLWVSNVIELDANADWSVRQGRDIAWGLGAAPAAQPHGRRAHAGAEREPSLVSAAVREGTEAERHHD